MGVKTCRGSVLALAGSGAVGGVSAQGAGMEVVAAVPERAGGVLGPVEAVDFVVWAKEGVPTFCSRGKWGNRRPAVVDSDLHSAGMWPANPHRKHKRGC